MGLLLAEKDSSGNVVATYLYDDKGQPVSMTRGGTTYYYNYNTHGDTIALVDQNGSVAATYSYDIWGNILQQTGNLSNPFTYAGQYGYVYDSESSLYFLQTRYYDPSIGRFISRDRFAGYENDPDSQNRYVYCHNDPVNNVDPSGHSTASLILDIISIILSIAMIANGFMLAKCICGMVVGFVAAGVALYDYKKQVAKINKTITNKTKRNYAISDANFWLTLGLISAAITVVCSVISMPIAGLVKYVTIDIVNAVGLCKGLAISNTLLAYDLTCALNHKLKYKY